MDGWVAEPIAYYLTSKIINESSVCIMCMQTGTSSSFYSAMNKKISCYDTAFRSLILVLLIPVVIDKLQNR